MAQMASPSFEDARRLVEWEPARGVISVYLRVEPGDRGGAWRTELRNGLAALRERAEALDHEARGALLATVERLEARFANHERDLPRGEIGFVEVAERAGEERWWGSHLSPRAAATVGFAPRPLVAPLLCLIEREAPRGVALVSAERVRLLEWQPGRLDELLGWELSVFVRDWRERRAQRVPDPARAQAVSSSGREHFDDRLADNRHRFLGECRALALETAGRRGWGELLAFGPSHHLEGFREHSEAASPPIELGGETDLISSPPAAVEATVAAAVERREAERAERLVGRVLERGQGGVRGSAGPQETLAALAEGRVERLVLDAAVAEGGNGDQPPGGAEVDAEQLVRRALQSGAAVSPVRGEPAGRLAAVGGVAALLRY